MPSLFEDSHWLEVLLEEELSAHDPVASLARLPPEIRAAGSSPTDLAPAARLLVARSLRRLRIEGDHQTPAEIFEAEVRAHLGLALDLSVLRRDPFVRAGRRAELSAFLAAALGDHAAALATAPHQPGGTSDRAVQRAARSASEALRTRFWPPGDPHGALPLHAGSVAILRRRLARVVVGYHRSGLIEAAALARHGTYAERESALLAESLAGVLVACGEGTSAARTLWTRDVARLGLSRAGAREVRHAIASPRPPAEIAQAAPESMRRFLVEQLRLAQLRLSLSQACSAWIEAFVAASGLDHAIVLAAQVEAAAQHGDHEEWIEAFHDGRLDWQKFAADWDAAADQVVERVSAAVTDNLEALVTEIRETGELGQLLARAAAGHALTADQKRKVKAQLIDLAKAVPALAIFAAPGGMLLLPLVAKLLPFSLMPSAWSRPGVRRTPPPPTARVR